MKLEVSLTDEQLKGAVSEAVLTAADHIPALVAAGKTDRQIAAELGRHWKYVADERRRLGLPCNREDHTPEMRAARSAVMRRLGPDVLQRASHRAAARRRAALLGRYNLPPDLTPTQARLLFALLNGPQTAAALAARVRPDAAARGHAAFQSPSRDGKNLLTELVNRGLVVGHRQSRLVYLYLPTLKALSLLSRTESP